MFQNNCFQLCEQKIRKNILIHTDTVSHRIHGTGMYSLFVWQMWVNKPYMDPVGIVVISKFKPMM